LRTSFIWAFTKFNGISWVTKSPANWIANIVTPICLLFIIYVLSAGRLVDFAIAGGFVAIVAAATLSVTGQTAMFRLEFKIQDLILATKASRIDYLTGFAFSELFFSLPGIAFFAIMSIVFGLFTFERLGVTLVVVFLLALATSSIAFFAGTRIKRTIGMWAISGIISALMTLVPPTFYPYTVLPQPLFYVFLLSPVTPAAATLQGVYGLAPMNYYMPVVLALEVIFYMGIARYFAKWRDN
jgi:ABC-2 type transport system permease protein